MESVLDEGKRTILLVEDEENVRRVTGRLLERLGFRVLLASSAEEALELYEGKGVRPDLVLTDVVMPGLTGIQLAERLRTLDPTLPILFTSGYTSRELGRTPDDPPSPFLPKPFSIDDLAHMVRLAMDRSPPH
jgi:two-component system, cell cycle sensor histidine kinase and response regulator CckA